MDAQKNFKFRFKMNMVLLSGTLYTNGILLYTLFILIKYFIKPNHWQVFLLVTDEQ